MPTQEKQQAASQHVGGGENETQSRPLHRHLRLSRPDITADERRDRR